MCSETRPFHPVWRRIAASCVLFPFACLCNGAWALEEPAPVSAPATGTSELVIAPRQLGLVYFDSSADAKATEKPFDETQGALFAEETPRTIRLESQPRPPVWTIDYRFRSLTNSNTAYEFGTMVPPPVGYSPLSRLVFPINSNWHGLEVGVQRETWGVHCEWLTPQQGISGDFADYDWDPPNPDGSFTDLGFSQERWTDGQMLDLGLEFQLTKALCGMPIEIWPTAGCRWQRFGIMCHDGIYVKEDNVWLNPPNLLPGNVLYFNQQYYIEYIGGQIRTRLEPGILRPIDLTFQGDWGHVDGYNFDHHLLRGERYTMEKTWGGSWHIGITAEMPINTHFTVGLQADYMEIRTHGTHHLLDNTKQINETWSNGVSVTSDQTALTVFVRLSI